MIIAFSGRARSGKTTLANEVIKYGYIKISYADKLKKLLSQIYGWAIETLSDTKKKEELLPEPVVWNEETAKTLAKLINTTKKLNSNYVLFLTRRDAMQYVGTQVLREYDSNFHVKELKKQIQSNINYVLDDVRFDNEYKLLQSLNATCIFVTRPYYKSYSNHDSEVCLNRLMFDYNILNDGNIKVFISKFDVFYQNIGHKFDLTRKKLISLLQDNNWNIGLCAKKLKTSVSKVKYVMNAYLIKPPCQYNDVFAEVNDLTNLWFNRVIVNGHINEKNIFEVEYDIPILEQFNSFINNAGEIVNNKLIVKSPYFIEDMKLWNYL